MWIAPCIVTVLCLIYAVSLIRDDSYGMGYVTCALLLIPPLAAWLIWALLT